MLLRRRLLGAVLAAVTLAGASVVALALRDDDGEGRESLDVIDPTTSTTRRRSTTEPTATTATTVPSTTAATTPPAPVAPTTRPAPVATTAAPPPTGLAAARIRLTPVANLGYPIAMAVHPGDGGLWIATKGGTVCQLQGSSCGSAQTLAAVSTGSEQGLLGITFDPTGARFYASYTDPAGDTRIDEFVAGGGGLPDPGSRRQIYAQDQPEANHNGGNILFGPDGYLYLGLGDGGGGGDQHGPVGNGQDPGTDLGKVLRINPVTHGIERWLSGVRNPWRFSFDRATGDLWVADVGQSQWEEITFLPAGAQGGRNLGWRCYEGTHAYTGCAPAGGHTGPIFEYSHAEGCSITGGYVYRGGRIPDLVGAYLFADYCDGELRAITQSGGRVTGGRRLGVDPGSVVSFGQDAAGELYVLTPTTVLRVDPA